MSQVIEDRIVELQFENKQFESGVQESLSTLDKLKNSLKFDDMSKNLTNFGKQATKNFDFSGIESNVESLKDRFSAAGIAGMEVIKRLTNFAIDAGKTIANVLSSPIQKAATGGWARAMNIENAKFQIEGLGKTWASVSDDIDYAVSGTAYSLDVAAQACAQLSASGIQAGEDMKAALRGISGVAAMGNTTYESITPIFTKAAGQGKVMADELNRISYHGLNASAELAKFFNTIKDNDNVPEDLKDQVLDLTKGLKVSESEIREFASNSKISFRMFSYAMDGAFGQHAKDANNTFNGAMANIGAALSRIGAEFATPLIQNAIPVLNKIREIINAIKANLEPFYNMFRNATTMISDALVGKLGSALDFISNKSEIATNLYHSLENIIESLLRWFMALKDAFNAVFPQTQSFGDRLNSLTNGFEVLTAKLIPSNEVLNVFRNIMYAVFTIIKAVFTIIKSLWPVISSVVSVIAKVAAIIANIIGYLASLVSQLNLAEIAFTAIKVVGVAILYVIDKLLGAFIYLKNVLTDTSTVTGRVFMSIKETVAYIAKIIGGALFNAFQKVSGFISGMIASGDPLGYIVNSFKALIDNLRNVPVLGTVINILERAFNAIKAVIMEIRNADSPIGAIALKLKNIALIVGGTLYLAVEKVIHAVKEIVTANNPIEMLISKVQALVEKFKNLSFVKDSINAVKNAFQGVVSIFKPVEDSVGKTTECVKTLTEATEKGGKVIQETFEMTEAYSNGPAMTGVTKTLSATGEAIDKTAKTAEKSGGILQKLGNIFSWLAEKAKGIKASHVVLAAFATIITILAFNTNKLVVAATKLTNTISTLPGFFKGLITGKKEPSTVFEKFATGIIVITGAILGLAYSIKMLKDVPTEKLHEIGVELRWLVGITAGAVVLVSVFSMIADLAGKRSSGFNGFAANMFMLSVGLLALVGAIQLVDNMNLKTAWKDFGILAAIMASLATIAIILSKIAPELSKGSLFLIAFAGAAYILVNALINLKNVDFAALKENWMQVGVILVAFGAAARLASTVGLGSVIGLLAFCAALMHLGKNYEALKSQLKNVQIGDFIMDFCSRLKKAIEGGIKYLVEAYKSMNEWSQTMLMLIAGAGAAMTISTAWAIGQLTKNVLRIAFSVLAFAASIALLMYTFGELSKACKDINQSTLTTLNVTIGLLGGFLTAITIVAALSEGDTLVQSKAGKNKTSTSHKRSDFLKQVRKTLLDIGILVAAVALFIQVVSGIPENDLSRATTLLWWVMGFISLITVVVAAITLCAEKNSGSKASINTFIGIIMLIGTLMGAFAVAMWYFSDFDIKTQWPQLVASIVAIIAVCGLIGLLMKAISKIQTTGAGAAFAGLALMIISLGGVVAAIYLIGKDDLLKVGAIGLALIAAIGTIILLVSWLAKSLDKTQVNKSTRKAMMQSIGLMIGLLISIAGSMILLSKYVKTWADFGRVAMLTGEIMLALGAVVACIHFIQKEVKQNMNTQLRQSGFIAAVGMMIAILATIAIAMIGFATTVKTWDDFGRVSLLLTEMMGALVILVGMIQWIQSISKKMKSVSDIMSFAGTITGIIALMGSIAAAMILLNKYIGEGDQTKVGNLLIALVATMAALELLAAGLVKFMEEVKGMDLVKSGAALAGMIAALYAITEIAKVVSEVNSSWDTLASKMAVMELALAGLEGLVWIISKIASNIQGKDWLGLLAGGGAMAALVGMFHWLAYIFTIIDSMHANPDDVRSRVHSMAIALAEIGAIFAVLAAVNFAIFKFGQKSAWAYLGLAGEAVGLGMMAALIGLFQWLGRVFLEIESVRDPDHVALVSRKIRNTLWELVGIAAVSVAATIGFSGLPSMYGMVYFFDQIGQVFVKISSINNVEEVDKITSEMIDTMWGFVWLLSVMGIATPLMMASLAAMPAMTELIKNFVTVAAAFKVLDGMGLTDMQATIDQLMDLLWKLTGLGAVNGAFQFIGTGLESIGKAIIYFGYAMISVSGGVVTFSQALDTLTASVMRFVSTGPSILGWFQNVANGVITLCASIITSITETGNAIVQTVSSIIGGIAAAIYGGGSQVYQASASVGTQAEQGLKDNIKPQEWGFDFTSLFAQGMSSGIGMIRSAAKSIGDVLVAYLAHCGPTEEPLRGDWKWGEDFTTIFAASMESPIGFVEASARNIGEKVKTGIGGKLEELTGISYDTGKSVGENLCGQLQGYFPNWENICGQYMGQLNMLSGAISSVMSQVSSAYAQGRGTLYDFESTLKSDYNRKMKEQRDLRVEFDKTGQSSVEMKNKLAKNNEELLKMSSQLKDFEKGKGFFKPLTDGVNDFSKALNGGGGGGGGGGGATGALKDFASELTNTLEGQMNIFQKFEKKEAMSKEELLGNMRSQIQGMQEWAVQMQSLAAKGIDEGLYQELAMMGPQGAEYVGAFAQMTAEELQEANTLWAQSLILPQNVAGQVAGAFSGIGGNMMQGLANGITGSAQIPIDSAVTTAKTIENEFADAAGVHSPSWIYHDIAEYMILGLANGIVQTARAAINAMLSVCRSVVNTAKGNLDPGFMVTIGKNLIYGLVKGLTDKDALKALSAQLEKLAKMMKEEEEDDNDMASPSKLWRDEIGRYLVLGLAEGIRMYSGEAVKAVDDLSDTTFDAIKGTIEEIGKRLEDEVDEPVITPVLDLSNVQEGMSTLSNMFSANQALTASATLNGDLQNGQLNGSRFGTTFIQNNYSPKALSRTEIYRQTKNQFSAYREAFS